MIFAKPFAKTLALNVGLIEKDSYIGTDDEQESQLDRLKEFQQMSIACSLEESKLAYYFQELNDEQEAMLAVIYSSTKPYLLGHAVNQLVNKLGSNTASAKDVADIAKMIFEQLIGSGAVSEKVANEMIFRLTGVEYNDEKS